MNLISSCCGLHVAQPSLVFFRMGEISAPTTTDLKGSHCVLIGEVTIDNFENLSTVRIHLGHSKTDQFSKGVDVYLGKMGQELCPVSVLLASGTCRK